MKTSRRDVAAAGTTAAMMAVAGSGPADGSPRAGRAKQIFDVIIVGGGSAGAVLAVLSQSC